MAASLQYVVITPVRNEESNFPRTVASVLAQSIRLSLWVIVDDGSSDGTASIADAAAADHRWIHVIHRSDRGCRQPGTGVIEAFYDGLAKLGSEPFEFLVKLDGDLAFAADYFERCFERFQRNPLLGIGGGVICREESGNLIVESPRDPAFHVRGATKIYRRGCWEAIGGLIRAPGWDTVDELKANMLGWTTSTFPELKLHQLKDTGSADGSWRNAAKNGVANYVTGYHPLFMFCKCVKRLGDRPLGVAAMALLLGFCSGYLRRLPRHNDRDLIRYVRREQLRLLTFRSSLWRTSS